MKFLTYLTLLLLLSSCNTSKKLASRQNPGMYSPREDKFLFAESIIPDSTNKLTNKIENLEVAYTVWGCACPPWIQTKDVHSKDTTRRFIDFHFYIEPADEASGVPASFDPFKHNLKIEGQFYEREDYPKGTIETEEPMSKAKLFRYTSVTVIDKTETH